MPTAPAVDRESVPIATLGAAALSVLHAHERGRVLAVFRRSFYVAFDNEVVCVGPLELGLGPLVALYARRNRLAWPHRGLDVGADVTRDGDTLSVGPGLRFDFGAVDPWQPPAAPPHSPATMRLGLQRLAVAARRRSPVVSVRCCPRCARPRVLMPNGRAMRSCVRRFRLCAHCVIG